MNDSTWPRQTSRLARAPITAASILLLLSAAFHLVAHFGPDLEMPDEQGREMVRLVESYRINLFGFQRTFHDIIDLFSLHWAIFCVLLGAINLAVLPSARSDARLLRRLTIVETIGVAALAAASFIDRILPPMITFGLVLLLLLVSLLAQMRSPATIRP